MIGLRSMLALAVLTMPVIARADALQQPVLATAGKVSAREFAAFRMMMVVKDERFTFAMVNRLLADGRPVPESVVTKFGGSFMGKAQTMTTQTRYSDVQSARP